jgi:hypothetical protein
MPVARKRPCCICHRWFRPDNRVGSRQRTCSKPACQASRRGKKQAGWRARNPDYFRARRMQARGARERPPEPLRLPAPLDQLPWDIAQSEFGVQGADFIGGMGALLLRSGQFQFKPYVVDSTVDSATLLRPAVQSQIKAGAYSGGSGAEDAGYAAGISSTGAAAGASSGAPA